MGLPSKKLVALEAKSWVAASPPQVEHAANAVGAKLDATATVRASMIPVFVTISHLFLF
jgi:hypothetical protein